MRIQSTVRVFAYPILVALWISATALAQSPVKVESVAAVTADQTEVRWQPQVEYGRLILTVSTPGGEVIRQEFAEGAGPSFKLTDVQGYNFPDGQYMYELRVVPKFSREAKKALAASREKGNSTEVIQELQRSGQLPTRITVQSGSFVIEKGAVFTGSPEEGTEPRGGNSVSTQSANGTQNKKKGGGTFTIQDQVIPDDLIVQGSACVGLDCVNNESFGFDTIRLKENSTRIKFDDTSTSAGFPANDWQLTANDSGSGGANKFSIEDITGSKVPFTITAGAATNSIFVDSTGRLGLRTATPVLDVHINTSNTPAHRLEQNNSQGFTAQTWDIAGNEANFFVRDVTGGSRLPFRIRPGAPTSSIDIAASGNVGIGTASPGSPLHLLGDADTTTFTGVPFNMQVLSSNTAASGVGGGILLGGAFNGTATTTFAVISGVKENGTAGNFAGALVFSTRVNGGTAAEKMRIGSNGNVGIGTAAPLGKLDVNGSIFQRGVQLFADYVFEPTYSLESIEDHSTFMWNNKHLPAVGARQVDEQGREVVEIGARMRGMLEEIEKAHIYISTLNESITEKDARLAKLERQNAELTERLARIEALVSASKGEKK
jgi:uncharacterized coiled-coil protein SlyX